MARSGRRSHCNRCGSAIVETNTAARTKYCPICTRARARARRRGVHAVGSPLIDITGARERLRAYIEQHREAIPDILDFVADRRSDYQGGQAA